MSETPYSPPRAPVADAPVAAADRRPLSATVALVLFGLFVVMRFYNLRFTLEQFRVGEITGLWFLLQAAFIVFFIVTGVLLAKRVAWARWAVALIVAWQLYELRWGINAFSDGMYGLPFGPLDVIIWLTPATCALIVAILVFVPARAWFRGRR